MSINQGVILKNKKRSKIPSPPLTNLQCGYHFPKACIKQLWYCQIVSTIAIHGKCLIQGLFRSGYLTLDNKVYVLAFFSKILPIFTKFCQFLQSFANFFKVCQFFQGFANFFQVLPRKRINEVRLQKLRLTRLGCFLSHPY